MNKGYLIRANGRAITIQQDDASDEKEQIITWSLVSAQIGGKQSRTRFKGFILYALLC